MARSLHVYPKAVLVGSEWHFIVKVYEPFMQTNSRFVHVLSAGVTGNLHELKVAFDLVVADSDTDQDVDDALFVDDIKQGPGVETVWGNWQARAEGIITGLGADPSLSEYWAAWTQQDTAAVRSDARRALITQRGWSVPHIHWHEGDGTVGNEVL